MRVEHLELRRLLSGTYYAGTDAEHGTELWYRDDSVEHIVADLNPGSASSNPRRFVSVDGKVYFVATGADGRAALYYSDDPHYAWSAFSADELAQPPELGTIHGRRLYESNTADNSLWSTASDADDLTFIGVVPQASRSIAYGDRLWFVGINGGDVSWTDGTRMQHDRQLETWQNSADAEGWYISTLGVENGWLSASFVLYTRDANQKPVTLTHTWYTDGAGAWTRGTVPGTPPGDGSGDTPGPDVGDVINGVLRIIGTTANDRITVRGNTLFPIPQFVVTLNGQEQSFAVQGINSIFIDGGDGADRIFLDESLGSISVGARISGGNGSDRITGGSSRDTIYAGHGNDTVEGGGGNDAIFGEVGNDSIRAGAGNDRINGGQGADRIDGGLGADTIAGESGRDTFFNDKKDDLLDFQTKRDRLA